MAKVPQLRKGLTPADLLEGSWTGKLVLDEPEDHHYEEFGQLRARIVKLACEALIETANNGDRVCRRDVKDSFAGIAYALKCASDKIRENMTDDILTPTILDRLAGV